MAERNSGALQVTLPSDKEILMQRVFDAPRHLVFEAMTKPEHVRVWWCCMPSFTMPVCEIDLRVGGRYRYVSRGPDGSEFGFHGVYREIVAPRRIVHTEIFEPYPDEETLCTVTLDERDGKTFYACHVLHKTTEGRDAHVASGMESGAGIALDRVEEIAQALAAAETSQADARPSGVSART
jgi:uncharacterized protein YndB with AHSA1/START domain